MEQSLSLTSDERKSINLSNQIQGWGADLDPKVRPGVPRDKAPDIGVELLYPSFEQQVPKFRIHKSTEHGRMTPVFGTSCPPELLSGALRDWAYKYSEGRLSHWVLLMVADQVNVVEGLVKDLASGHIPNIYKEMGLATEWKYNRKGLIKKAAIVGAGALAVAALAAAVTRKKEIIEAIES